MNRKMLSVAAVLVGATLWWGLQGFAFDETLAAPADSKLVGGQSAVAPPRSPAQPPTAVLSNQPPDEPAQAPPTEPSLTPQARAGLLTELGTILVAGHDLARLEQVCERGLGEACSQVAESYLNGANGAARSERIAKGYMLKACTRGDPFGCTAAGELTADGVLLETGCARGDGKACTLLGRALLAQTGSTAPTAERRAVQWLEWGCDRFRGAEGCAVLATLYTDGRGVARDEGLAKRYRHMACRKGLASACN